jgi:hypothetical protein
MANELRRHQNFIGGLVEDNPLTVGATTLTSAGLADVTGGVGSTQHLAIVLDPDGVDGDPEVVWVTALTGGAGSATIARGKEGTVARQHDMDTPWVHAFLADDVIRHYVLSPSADTYLNSQLATTNFGTATTLWIGDKFDTGTVARIALFAFDISALSGLTVMSAQLRLTRDEASPSTALTSANRLIARRVKRAFVGSEATWNIYSTGNNWATAGARGGADVETPTYTAAMVVGDRDQDVWTLDLSEMVKDAVVAGDTTLRFLVGWAIATASQNTIQVGSQDNATAAKRPVLSITAIGV